MPGIDDRADHALHHRTGAIHVDVRTGLPGINRSKDSMRF